MTDPTLAIMWQRTLEGVTGNLLPARMTDHIVGHVRSSVRHPTRNVPDRFDYHFLKFSPSFFLRILQPQNNRIVFLQGQYITGLGKEFDLSYNEVLKSTQAVQSI